MLRNLLGRLFPYALVLAWIGTAAYTVTSVRDLGAASAQIALGARARPPAPRCDCFA